ncbi:hypothetical protein [Enterococcus timonensis]|uniref:hypothetical protein n=1 Tax=Enterococcus timonensis TaxID=1852364 RepID=UPI0008D9976D|nr:hypothetical protein [Enterococcus timonensis]
MNRKKLAILFNVNLLYANPQTTDQQRKKGKKGRKLFRSLLNQYILLSVIFVLSYSVMFISIDLANYPGFFTMYLALFALMAFAQSVSVIYNVFYESHDLEDYLPLPFKQSEVFFAKFGIVAVTIFPFVLPILAIFLVTTLRSNILLPVAVLWSLVLFFLFFALMFSFYLLVVASLTQTKVFLRHKSIFSTAMMFLSSLGMIAGIFYINNASEYTTDAQGVLVLKDQPTLLIFAPFHQLAVHPATLTSLLIFVACLALLALLLFLIVKIVIPKFYLQANITPAKKAHKIKENTTPQTISRQLLTYNFNLIKDPTLLMQFFSSSIIIPAAFIMPFAISSGLGLGQLDWKFTGVSVLVGAVFAYLATGNASIVSVIISLDRENFNFIKSLPFSLRHYLKIKYWFAASFQGLLTGVIMLIGGIALHLPWFLTVGLVAGNLLGTIIFSWYAFYRDYRLLTLNWTNITQLYSRGGGNFSRMLVLLVGTFVGILAIVLLALLSNIWPIVGNLLVLIGIVLAAFIAATHYEKVFWKKLD